jgi:hypothetical protein
MRSFNIQDGSSLERVGAPLFEPLLERGGRLVLMDQSLDLVSLGLLVGEIPFHFFGVLQIVKHCAVDVMESDRGEAVLDLLRRGALFEVVHQEWHAGAPLEEGRATARQCHRRRYYRLPFSSRYQQVEQA